MRLTGDLVGKLITKDSWKPNTVFELTAVGKRKILVDRGDGYEDVLLNDDNFIVLNKEGGTLE